jgi:hypothetical protein
MPTFELNKNCPETRFDTSGLDTSEIVAATMGIRLSFRPAEKPGIGLQNKHTEIVN